MNSPFSNFRYCEQGIFIPLLVLLLFVFLSLAGLAIDGTRLYQARLAAQVAADAGSMAGAGMLSAFNGWKDVEAGDNTELNIAIDKAETAAKDIAVENLKAKGYTARIGFPTADWQTSTNSMLVNVSTSVETLLIRALPYAWLKKKIPATGTATAHISPAIVSLIIDVSKSMNCPTDVALGASDASCTCLPNCNSTFSGTADQKIEVLKEALTKFTAHFHATRDRMNLVAYGTGAKVLVEMSSGSNFDRNSLENEIAGLAPKGGTNTSDGFFRAYWDTYRAGNYTKSLVKDIAYVHFADGAPSAVRFFAAKDVDHSAQDPHRPTLSYVRNNVLGQCWSNFDYLNWSINVGCGADFDEDSIANNSDNCPTIANPDQEDEDDNGRGDLCDGTEDQDGDSVIDGVDNCPATANPGQADNDGDGIGDTCDHACEEARKTVPNVLYGTPPEDPSNSRYYDPHRRRWIDPYWDPYNLTDVDPNPIASSATRYNGAKRIAYSYIDYDHPWRTYDDVIQDLTIYLPDDSARCLRPNLWTNFHQFGKCSAPSSTPICSGSPSSINHGDRSTLPGAPNCSGTCSGFSWNWNNGDHLRFYTDVALLYADFMRNEGGRWYTIGHGRLSSAPTTDPYLGVEDLTSRKDTFLSRASNDPCAMDNKNFPGVEPVITIRSPRLLGAYYPKGDGSSEELEEAFEAIARKIKLSLIH